MDPSLGSSRVQSSPAARAGVQEAAQQPAAPVAGQPPSSAYDDSACGFGPSLAVALLAVAPDSTPDHPDTPQEPADTASTSAGDDSGTAPDQVAEVHPAVAAVVSAAIRRLLAAEAKQETASSSSRADTLSSTATGQPPPPPAAATESAPAPAAMVLGSHAAAEDSDTMHWPLTPTSTSTSSAAPAAVGPAAALPQGRRTLEIKPPASGQKSASSAAPNTGGSGSKRSSQGSMSSADSGSTAEQPMPPVQASAHPALRHGQPWQRQVCQLHIQQG